LGTSYVDVVERIVELMEDLADPQLALAVDTTGVGRPDPVERGPSPQLGTIVPRGLAV
jgi:hypothetical protein